MAHTIRTARLRPANNLSLSRAHDERHRRDRQHVYRALALAVAIIAINGVSNDIMAIPEASAGARLEWRVARVVDIRDETPRVRTLVLDLPQWRGHRAGQHVDVRLVAEDGYQAQRSYSIASAPDDRTVSLTVERPASFSAPLRSGLPNASQANLARASRCLTR